jgi:hypothetical protein
LINASAYHKPTPQATRANNRKGRVFAFTLSGGFFFLALFAYWRGGERVAAVAAALVVISFLAGVFIPRRLEPVERAWMKLGAAIGYLTTPVLMAAVYYLILTPIALVRRVARRRHPLKDSHWHQRTPSPPPARMERQF